MAKNNSKSFITFEGGEGAGKSSLIQRIDQELKKRKFDLVVTREPGGSLLGEQIRQWLLNREASEETSLRAELLLFLAARAQHVERLIRPALLSGKVVLCDRFNDSTIAYQGVARELGIAQVEMLCNFACEGIVPGLTFFLDVDPVEGLRRARHATVGQLDRIESEKLEFHQRVREGMRQLAKKYPERISVVDAHQTQEQVFQQVLSKIEEYLS